MAEQPVAAAPTRSESEPTVLEDFILQAEIYLQYGMRSKALERLERVSKLFPSGTLVMMGRPGTLVRSLVEIAFESAARAWAISSGTSGTSTTTRCTFESSRRIRCCPSRTAACISSGGTSMGSGDGSGIGGPSIVRKRALFSPISVTISPS